MSQTEKFLTASLIVLAVLELVLLPLYPILDKSEARYALVALRMHLTNDWVTPTIDGIMPFWSKPPLAYWASAISMDLFGVNEFTARLSVFLATAATVWLTIDLGRQGRDRSLALLAGCVLASMGYVLPMAGYVLTDQMLMLCVTLAMVTFWRAMTTGSRLAGYLFFVALASVMLTKGLVGLALIGPALLAWLIWTGQFKAAFRILPVIPGGLLMLVLAVPWFVVEEHRTPGFLHYFILGEHLMKFIDPGWKGDLYGTGRARPIGWVWPVVIVGTLPWSAFVLGALVRPSQRRLLMAKRTLSDPWIRYLLLWGLVPLGFFTLARNGGLPYVLPALPPIALLIAQALRDLGADGQRGRLAAMIAAVPVVLVVAVALTWIRPFDRHIPTEKNIVALWREERPKDSTEPLVYIYEKPYSADFYTGTTALRVADGDAAMAFSAEHNQHFFAIQTPCLILLPRAMREKFEIAGIRNATALLRARDASSAPGTNAAPLPWPKDADPAQTAATKRRCTL